MTSARGRMCSSSRHRDHRLTRSSTTARSSHFEEKHETKTTIDGVIYVKF